MFHSSLSCVWLLCTPPGIQDVWVRVFSLWKKWMYRAEKHHRALFSDCPSQFTTHFRLCFLWWYLTTSLWFLRHHTHTNPRWRWEKTLVSLCLTPAERSSKLGCLHYLFGTNSKILTLWLWWQANQPLATTKSIWKPRGEQSIWWKELTGLSRQAAYLWSAVEATHQNGPPWRRHFIQTAVNSYMLWGWLDALRCQWVDLIGLTRWFLLSRATLWL